MCIRDRISEDEAKAICKEIEPALPLLAQVIRSESGLLKVAGRSAVVPDHPPAFYCAAAALYAVWGNAIRRNQLVAFLLIQ